MSTESLAILCIGEHPELLGQAARWFHEKWGVPEAAYRESMEESVASAAVPQWYVVTDGQNIAAGAGVIENDFHDRKDLSPNVCAVYVEKPYRCRGVAGRLLKHICADMQRRGMDTLYLFTDHTSFYERYGWEFFCMAQGDGESEPSRLYVHRA